MRRCVFLILLAACAAPKPPAPEFDAPATTDTLVAPVVAASAAVPGPGTAWTLLAVMDDRIDVVDFDSHRVGAYPGMTKAEVPHPTSLFAIGDTIVVGDWGLRRFTEWAGGQRIAAWPVPEVLRGAYPRARDAAGQWYFEVAPDARTDGAGLLDSAAVVRADAQLTKFDTIARLAPGDLYTTATATGKSFQRRALSGQDAWGVLPDGTLWIARVYQNRIEWHRPGGAKLLRGPLLPDFVLAIKPMDRNLYLNHFPEENREAARQQILFSAVKPPFERVFAAPDGRIWLFKSDTALAPVRRFQVVDSTGLLMYVRVPSRGTALGVTREWILMGEEFPGGVRLMRYAVPAEAKQ